MHRRLDRPGGAGLSPGKRGAGVNFLYMGLFLRFEKIRSRLLTYFRCRPFGSAATGLVSVASVRSVVSHLPLDMGSIVTFWVGRSPTFPPGGADGKTAI